MRQGTRTAIVSGLALAGTLATLPCSASSVSGWLAGPDATGDWFGARKRLGEHGVRIDVDYTAEVFVRDDGDGAYRGNLDLFLEVDTGAAGMWKGGTLFAYGQAAHGDNISDELELVMPVSNYESESFAQTSELWLYQELPYGLSTRLGKQDANQDFAAPRFAGNFVNSSFGVLPTSPMPSFPAPSLGVAAFFDPAPWLGLGGGAYDGAPRVHSFSGGAFDDDEGVFGIGAARLQLGRDGPRDLACQAGGWHLSDTGRSGGFAIADLLVHLDADRQGRSVQVFVRTNFEPDAGPEDAELYVGGGATAHGFLGSDNTVGAGTGYVSIDGPDEAFVELFFKWRPLDWLTIEPDVQTIFASDDVHAVFGLRTEIKL
jgi:porin